ncbi:Hypothetical predicted protein [Cloeon dipterum]|uniref:Protein krueppel n=1 Tax=Cloeon dipterum TaxID=197152 RepID=A0A8S1BM24_9INSE|nr:Hypothetical predicted protein [Cloeon dipterum]
MSSDFIFSDNLLYNSDICRLCGEKNSNGELLFNEEDENALGFLVNKYLPVKVKDDGKLPRTICPGCNIQVQATIQFFELLVAGQQKIRSLFAEQREQEKKMAIGIANIPEVEGEDGKLYMMITVPSEKETMYPDDDPISLKMEGLERPRKKRGRPRKQEPEAVLQEKAPITTVEPEAEVDADGRIKRKRKIPQRFLESVAGSELERVFKEQGVIDDDDRERIFVDGLSSTEKVTQVIGRTVNQDGEDLGGVIVLTKSKGLSEDRQNFRPKKKLFTCSICQKSFAKRKLFQIHRIQDHSWKFECEVCKEHFLDEESVRSHQVSSSHEGVINLDDKIDELDDEILDPLDFLSVETSVDPNSAEDQVFVCPACQVSFMSADLLLAHMKSEHEGLKPFKCSQCVKAFAFPKSLARHLELSHGLKDSSLDKFNEKQDSSCKVCDKKFNSLSSLFYHKEKEHGPGILFACNKCDKSFKHRQLLQRHQLVHTEERPYVCTVCTMSFKTKPNLTSHMIIHTGEKKFFCDRCGQQFAHKTSLVLHHRWHNGEKPYQCKYCKKAFSQNGNLREHMRIHTGEKPFFCNFCGRRFTTSSQFKLHIKRHTDTWKCHVRRHKGEKPYACHYCQRGFTEHWALRKHLRIHTGEKPYVCEICNKAFADCSNLNKHKKVHRGLPESGAKSEAEDGSVVLQLVGEEDENGTLPVIYVSYNQQAAAEDIDNHENQPELVSSAGSVLRQITNVEQTGLVLSTVDGQEVILNTLGGELPMVVPAQSQLQLPEGIGAAGATLQMQAGEDGVRLPVTLAVEDGQLVAHIPTSSDFMKEKESSESSKGAMKDVPPVQFQLVTEDGRAVQLISNATDAAAAFSIDFSEES